ncbi:MAG: DUF736 family protein [Alphaproteobacteria bacterium]
MHISKFSINDDGTHEGKINALGLGSVIVASKPAVSKEEKAYFRLYSKAENGEEYEIGSMWPRVKDGLNYFSVSLDSPFFPEPINAALFYDKHNPKLLNMVWQRQKPKAEAAPVQTPENGTRTADDETVLATAILGNETTGKPTKTRRITGMKAAP